MILDGKCATTSASLPDLKYRLVRVLGKVLGLGWSQLNLNAITGSPAPSADDIAGLPVMHAQDLLSCVPISKCFSNADQPRMDDRAALSRLYPVTSEDVAQFAGKQIFAANTARIRGSVRFKDADGNPGQPMQGVNVVARWMDMGTNQPSRRYAASSVSGFLFCGNAGNAITGYTDIFGQPYSRFGSSDTLVEGFFDLAGLEIPSGDTAQFQLSIEPIDPYLSQSVGPYAPWQVAPSGGFDPIVVTVRRGDTVEQDIVMNNSAIDLGEIGTPDKFTVPNPLPKTGDWMGSLNGYGDADYFWFAGRTDRTLAVEVTALDENGQPVVQRAQPVIGMWSLEAPEGTPPPAYTLSPFNTLIQHAHFRPNATRCATAFHYAVSRRHCGCARGRASRLSLSRAPAVWRLGRARSPERAREHAAYGGGHWIQTWSDAKSGEHAPYPAGGFSQSTGGKGSCVFRWRAESYHHRFLDWRFIYSQQCPNHGCGSQ